MTARAFNTFSCLPAALLVVTASCASSTEEPSEDAPPLSLTALTDLNPDPDIIEVELAAAEGTVRYLADGKADIWGYRDAALPHSRARVPGPVLDVRQGQRVIVHFRNELPEATTIHWHGLRVPNMSDGTPSVQHAVEPGETFDYEFEALDSGTFWYHPHLRSDVQIERGLYGAVVVRGGPKIPVDADRVFVLDDVKLLANGKLSDDTTQLDVMLGRQGNVVLANGVRRGEISVKHGARERWRFVNSANGRYFNLRLRGHTFTVVSWDGGVLSEPYDTDKLLIAPGERYEVLLRFPDRAGTDLTVETLHYDRGHDVPDPGPLPVFDIRVDGSASSAGRLPGSWGAPVDLEVPSDAPERVLKLAEESSSDDGLPRFFFNDRAFPDVPAVQATSGAVEVWRVENDTEMDHPFHVHGLFFRVLEVDGEPAPHSGWKDTVNLPSKQTVLLGLRYGEPGTWMYHCHILEHAERGMMAELTVVEEP
ncbi:MAG TPA: multicopper oxidase family protein [Polyangiales bacterium]|nr:multicopper oxidase family protein [Polyangiales bacterium]